MEHFALGRSRRLRAVFAGVAAVCVALTTLAISSPAQGAPSPQQCNRRNNDTAERLLECVTVDQVVKHLQRFQDIATANGGNRVSGYPGYDESVEYVVRQLRRVGYDVTIQPFDTVVFNVLGASQFSQVAPTPTTYVESTDFNILQQSDPGTVQAPVTPVDLQLGLNNTSTSGCEAADFTGFPTGNIALIQRGTCPFEQKIENAATAGAAGVIFFNQGNTTGADRQDIGVFTLGAGNTSGIPAVFVSYSRGVAFSETAGLVTRMFVNTFREVRETYNVLADMPGRQQAETVVMAGAHLDSVAAGPGINDNGSGSAALLEVAIKMANVRPVNDVRFAWWGAEESNLVGSTYYVANLSDEEIDDIALYLNFDMVASPNYVRFVYDGDGSGGPGAPVGPAGSAEIEQLFVDFYASRGLASAPTPFNGRSDYGPFIAAGVLIPAGGLFTGAEGIKTAEQAAIYGGTAGRAYDPNYHQVGDTIANINREVLDVNADAIGHAVITYAMTPAEELPGAGAPAAAAARAGTMEAPAATEDTAAA
jgi:Zn-dependent M28 family amino/carboxypeptidase